MHPAYIYIYSIHSVRFAEGYTREFGLQACSIFHIKRGHTVRVNCLEFALSVSTTAATLEVVPTVASTVEKVRQSPELEANNLGGIYKAEQQ